MQELQIILNHAMRLAARESVRDHTPISDLCEKTGILPLNQLVAETTLLECWRSLNHSLPSSDLFSFPTNYIVSRSHASNMLNTPLVKHNTDFIWKATALWNRAGTDIRVIDRYKPAKDYIKFHTRMYNLQ